MNAGFAFCSTNCFSERNRVLQLADGKPCPHPAVPLYAQVSLSDELQPGSRATYACDDGYELFGSSVRTCDFDGKWTGELPYCGE